MLLELHCPIPFTVQSPLLLDVHSRRNYNVLGTALSQDLHWCSMSTVVATQLGEDFHCPSLFSNVSQPPVVQELQCCSTYTLKDFHCCSTFIFVAPQSLQDLHYKITLLSQLLLYFRTSTFAVPTRL